MDKAVTETSALAGPLTDAAEARRISVLGATGSIGTSTLDLISRNADAYDVVALTAHSQVDKLAALAIEHRAEVAVIGDETLYPALKDALAGHGIEAAAGDTALEDAGARDADWTMAAIMGAAGLKPTLAAVRRGKTVALANKECLVCAGGYFMSEVASSATRLLPVDSEHSAVSQALETDRIESLVKLTITASGGPFRKFSSEQLAMVTPKQALKHPNWSMGAKITIDSATLMNKGLELIEAYHLFPVTPDQLDAIVHPQSIVHCLVSYEDGSVLAHLGEPDMRTPIAVSLAWPKRMKAPVKPLDLVAHGELTFEAPDPKRFRCLALAKTVLSQGDAACSALNAANEVAVSAFLNETVSFLDIPKIVESVLEDMTGQGSLGAVAQCVDDVVAVDVEARAKAVEKVAGLSQIG